MKQSIIRISQAAPEAAAALPPVAAPDPMAGMGAAPLDMGMGAMGAPPAAAAAAAPTTDKKILRTPIESSGMILLDADVEKRLKEQFSTGAINSTSEQTIANDIWKEYGGTEISGVNPSRKGKRKENTEVDDAEIKRTEDSKWERLPEGKTLADLDIKLEDLVEMVTAWSQGIASLKKKEAPAGGGGGMGLASFNLDKLIKTAKTLDEIGQYSLADKII